MQKKKADHPLEEKGEELELSGARKEGEMLPNGVAREKDCQQRILNERKGSTNPGGL